MYLVKRMLEFEEEELETCSATLKVEGRENCSQIVKFNAILFWFLPCYLKLLFEVVIHYEKVFFIEISFSGQIRLLVVHHR